MWLNRPSPAHNLLYSQRAGSRTLLLVAALAVATVASPQSACGPVLDSVLLWGGANLGGSVRGTDIDDCCLACSARQGCAAFTFVPWASSCLLRAADGWASIPASYVQSVVLDNSSLWTAPPPSPSPPRPRPPPTPSPPRRRPPPPRHRQRLAAASPPPAVDMPRINHGQCLNGSQPRLVQLLGPARSTYHFYHPEYRVSTLYCADAFASRPRAWALEYPWVAYCAPYLGGMTQDKCGRLMRVTNIRTGAAVVVRLVDMCGHSAIDADQQTAFIPLDTDGRGYLDGQLSVTLELVAC